MECHPLVGHAAWVDVEHVAWILYSRLRLLVAYLCWAHLWLRWEEAARRQVRYPRSRQLVWNRLRDIPTYTYGSVGTTASAPSATPATTTGATLLSISATAFSCIGFFNRCLRLASKLYWHLAFENILAREVCDGPFCFLSRFQIDKGIANRSVCAWIDRDGRWFTAPRS